MLRVSFDARTLVQRLRERAGLVAQDSAASHPRRLPLRRADWRSAAALWPDFAKDRNDGK